MIASQLQPAAKHPQPTFSGEMVLQLPCSGRLGTDEELYFRHGIQDIMADFFELEPVGKVTGGDIGRGTMNIFMTVAPETHEKVLTALLQVINVLKIADIALIAYAVDATAELEVLWPKDYAEVFSLL